MSDELIPVTFLVGFLGSGKTTLLNRLLTQPGGEPIAVVVNEFGDAGIDGSLVVGGGEELIELDGGCICCTVRGDLSRTLRDLAARRRRRLGRRLKFERVVIEASGLASPGPAVQTLVLDGELAERYRVDGVVAMASLPLITDQLARFSEASEQLAYADLVIETHGDRVGADGQAAAKAAISKVSPGAGRAQAIRGDIDAQQVFGLNPGPEALAERIEALAQAGHGEAHEHDHAPGVACESVAHDSGMSSVSLRTSGSLRREALEIWLRFLGQSRRAEVLRIKGIMALAGEAQAWSVQGVHQWLELSPLERSAPSDSVLVIIGRNLNRGELERAWAKLQS
ncbi:MAG: G3E family GTPase [Planctomycetota bacterium]|jgi:G3E family GTPase